MTTTCLFPSPWKSLSMSLVLFSVLLTACASGNAAHSPTELAASQPSATPFPVRATDTPTVDLTATYLMELQSATPASDVKPAATSRGPELHATDPSTVRLASGGLQLVEFFRFT